MFMYSSFNRETSKKVALTAILAALALALSYLERLIPFELFVPIPGFRLGLSNIVLLFSVFTLPFGSTFSIFAVKVGLTALLFGTPISFAMSFTGGAVSIVAMMVLQRLLKQRCGPVGISVTGAVFHNIGQLAAAMAVLGSPAVIYYLPALTAVGIITGAVTGLAAAVVFRYSNISEVFTKRSF